MASVSRWVKNTPQTRIRTTAALVGVAKLPLGVSLRFRRHDGIEMVLELDGDDLRLLDQRRSDFVRDIARGQLQVVGGAL